MHSVLKEILLSCVVFFRCLLDNWYGCYYCLLACWFSSIYTHSYMNMVIVNWLLIDLRQIWHVWGKSKAWQIWSSKDILLSVLSQSFFFFFSSSDLITCPWWMNSSLDYDSFFYLDKVCQVSFFFISSLFRFLLLLLLFLQIVGRPLPSTGKQILLVINSTTIIFRFLILRIYLHFNEGKEKEKKSRI